MRRKWRARAQGPGRSPRRARGRRPPGPGSGRAARRAGPARGASRRGSRHRARRGRRPGGRPGPRRAGHGLGPGARGARTRRGPARPRGRGARPPGLVARAGIPRCRTPPGSGPTIGPRTALLATNMMPRADASQGRESGLIPDFPRGFSGSARELSGRSSRPGGSAACISGRNQGRYRPIFPPAPAAHPAGASGSMASASKPCPGTGRQVRPSSSDRSAPDGPTARSDRPSPPGR